MAKRYVRKKRRGPRLGLWAVLLALGILIVALVVAFGRGQKPDGTQGDGLWDGSWYEDDLGIVKRDRPLIRGMKSFEKLTGVRPYLTLMGGVDPEELNAFAEDQYEALFGSGDHLLVVYDEWQEGTYYLAARTGKESALSAQDVDYLLSCLEKAYADPANGTYAAAFGAGFDQAAEELSIRSGSNSRVNLLLGLGLLLVAMSLLLFLFLHKKSRRADA